jgi:hypothetical protein
MEQMFFLLAGLTGREQVNTLSLGDGSYNFYPDDEGYLVNYPGRVDMFVRVTSNKDVPPTTNKNITRVFVFRDVRGYEHIVFVRGAELCRVHGNGYEVLYTFTGQTFGAAGYYPYLFVHESKLIVVNFGDAVQMWDGVEGVHPLGVQEAPMAPDARETQIPYTETSSISYGYGAFRYKCYFWPGVTPHNGPGENLGVDGTTRVDGIYECVVQFFDKYGNHGCISSASRAITVIPNRDLYYGNDPAASSPSYSDNPAYKAVRFLTLDYYPPMIESHIAGVRIGRTQSLNSDGGAGERGLYWTDTIVEETTTGRAVLRISDGTLAEQTPIDVTVRGPTQATIGCSALGRIFLAGHEDPYRLTFSDVALFGQFRPLNEYHALDHVRCVIQLSDRVVVITRSTVEVLYDNNGLMAVLEQNKARGSNYGRSFVDVGGAIFGLWSDGFGFYDGQKHTTVEAPYFLQDLYVDSRFFIHTACKYRNWYVLTINKDSVSNENNYLIIYDLVNQHWFLIKEKVFDVTVWKDCILGCDDSIYELFKGDFPATAVAYFKGLIPDQASPMQQRNLVDIRLLMEPSSVDGFDVQVEGEFTTTPSTSYPTHSMPSKSSMSRQTFPHPWWDEKFLYTEQPDWLSPRDVWITPQLGKGVPGYSHAIELTFPTGHRVRLKAMGLSFGNEGRSSIT